MYFPCALVVQNSRSSLTRVKRVPHIAQLAVCRGLVLSGAVRTPALETNESRPRNTKAIVSLRAWMIGGRLRARNDDDSIY